MKIQKPIISQPTITAPTITDLASLEGDGANITGSFSGSFDASAFDSPGLGIVSASAQVVGHLPTGTVSSSAQTVANLPSGTVSGSEQILAGTSIVSASSIAVTAQGEVQLTTNGVAATAVDLGLKTDDNVEFANVTVTGDLSVTGTTTSVNSNTLNIGDNIISLNGTAATKGGLAVNDATGTTTSGSLLWDGTNDYWVAGPTGSEVKVMVKTDVLVSASALSSPAQGEVTLTTNGVAASATDLGLQTSDDVQFDSFGVGTAASGTTGEIRATGDITAYYSSDERLKENFTPLAGALDKVKAIGGYEFDWKEGIEDVVSKTGHDIGVKAQELQAQYPELVHERDNGYLAVDYIKLNAVLIEAVKELAAKVEELSK
jgi:hypothetical protein